MKRLTASVFSRFRTSERGAVLVEMLITLPVITVLAVGLLEFGFIFYERQQLQVGVRDAARYMSRCASSSTDTAQQTVDLNRCIQTARTIAFFGTAAPTASPRIRVRGWGQKTADWPTQLVISYRPPTATQKFPTYVVTGKLAHVESPMYSLLRTGGVAIEYRYSSGFYEW